MAITRWNPFIELEQLLDRYQRGSTLPDTAGKEIIKQSDWTPVVDISETPDEFLIKAELPGVNKEDIKINVHDGVLTIQGERHAESEEKDKKHHRIERFYGSFARSFSLPDNVDPHAIKAESKDGLLLLHLLKQEQPKPKTVEIQVQ
ncbi:MAG: Hsp20/alpha crystallin family protein [Hahellaceae bacterium]|nr:Hsp20/alpha crystallin family protein [Hahellaceae bacterium]